MCYFASFYLSPIKLIQNDRLILKYGSILAKINMKEQSVTTYKKQNHKILACSSAFYNIKALQHLLKNL